MEKRSIYEQIKKQNGEAFAKAIRNYDNGIFDVPDIVEIVKYAGQEAEPILPYLTSLKNVKIEEVEEPQDPIKLLDKAGYNAYYADTLSKQNLIEKYYASSRQLKCMRIVSPGHYGEKLCTFSDKNRYKNYYIINAVKKNVNKIKRKDFIGKEKREDEYGTSVLSIQIAKSGGFISIKNRYNHTVENPDNTFNSNPDNIINGLSAALKKRFNVDFSSQQVDLPENFVIFNNHIIRYNYERNNVYFAASCYVKDGKIYSLKKGKELMLDTCIFNVQRKVLISPCRDVEVPIKKYTQKKCGNLEFVLANELNGKKTRISKNKNGGYDVLADGVSILTTKEGKITALNLPTTKEIVNYKEEFVYNEGFLYDNKVLRSFVAPNLIKVGKNFLYNNELLTELTLSKLKIVESNFLYHNKSLEQFNAQKLRDVGHNFLHDNRKLYFLNTPELKNVESYFLYHNEGLKQLDLHSLELVGYAFLYYNKNLRQVCMPKLKEVDDVFLFENRQLRQLDLQHLEKVGRAFLGQNRVLCQFIAPKLKNITHTFMMCNECLQQIDLRSVEKIGDDFLSHNNTLQQLNVPKLTSVGCKFLCLNTTLQILNAPILESVKYSFLCNNSIFKTNALYVTVYIGADRILPASFEMPLTENSADKQKKTKIVSKKKFIVIERTKQKE